MPTPFAANRRWAMLAFAAALMAGPASAATYRYTPAEGDMVLGKAKAPVTVVLYASVGCPHCATWDIEVFPALKAKYIDTGKIRFVYRELLTGQPQVAMFGFVTARCAAPDKYFDVVHDLYARQAEILRTGDLRAGLVGAAQKGGLDEAAWEACVKDEARINAIQARSDRNAVIDRVQGTPAFLVNGVMMTDGESLEHFDKAIAAAKSRR